MSSDNYMWKDPDPPESKVQDTPDVPKDKKRGLYEKLLQDQQDMLILFSGDERLTYTIDDTGEHFILRPAGLEVLVPLLFFQSQKYDERRFLFHLYEVLALYPDYTLNPECYLERGETFRKEAEEMTAFFLDRVKAAHLEHDAAYRPSAVFLHYQDEIVQFFEDCDTYVSILTVLERAPEYKLPDVKKDIGKMLLLEDAFPSEDNPLAVHRDLAPSLLVAEFYGTGEIGTQRIRDALDAPVFGKSRFAFLREQLISLILRHKGIRERDALIHAILLPVFLSLWKDDIRGMELSATIKTEEEADRQRAARKRKSASLPKGDYEKMLHDLSDEKKAHAKASDKLIQGEKDLSAYGVTKDDTALFNHYEQLVRPAREEMKRYWRKLIGETSREVSVRIENQPKGVLNIPALIRSWPSFTEAERRQNYKDLAIFDTYELRKQTRVLPRYLDISFVIDSSGSMRGEKLGPAREALSIVLLSLEDFALYLGQNAARTHEICEVRTESWLFGTRNTRILSFDDRADKRQADIIRSVAHLDGSLGSTDDGACLNEILKEQTPEEIRQQKAGRRIRMIFIVTDGASSFPGTAKKAVTDLLNSGVLIQALGIGSSSDPAAKASFDYVYENIGIYLGSDTQKLPSALITAVKKDVGNALRKHFRKN